MTSTQTSPFSLFFFRMFSLGVWVWIEYVHNLAGIYIFNLRFESFFAHLFFDTLSTIHFQGGLALAPADFTAFSLTSHLKIDTSK